MIFALGHRIVFVVVALSASHRQAEPVRGGHIHAVEENVEPLLFGDRAPFAVDQVVARPASGARAIFSANKRRRMKASMGIHGPLNLGNRRLNGTLEIMNLGAERPASPDWSNFATRC
jgi:hypothetical protein